MSKLEKYLPKKQKKVLVQVHLDPAMAEAIEKYIRGNGLSWPGLIRALLAKLKDDQKL